MKTKKTPINSKKIPYYLALALLTAGASLILGFLSFSGMYALLPCLPLAFAAFGLSVAYEGEIYLQNIKGALNKIFKNNYLKNLLAKEYLLEHFSKNTEDASYPEFFKDYKEQVLLLATLEHKKLTPEQKKQKKELEKTIKDREKWFSLALFPINESSYSQEFQNWLIQNNQAIWQAKLIKRRSIFYIASAFSALSALFMSLGSTYLIGEAFSVIPWIAAIPFAALPIIIVPMALIAGTAYGLLTYNTITDLINHDTLNKFYKQIADNLGALSVRTAFMASMTALLIFLGTALTICTAGTWWTIASNAQPLFNWMKKMPSFIMGVINPLVTGLSAVFFNIQNTSESLEMLDETTKSLERTIKSKTNIFQMIYQDLSYKINHLRSREHWLQIINPPRLLLKLTITPLRILFFLGHLASIALTADRMPGVPQIVAALIALITEGFEDAHYFIGHRHEHHHHCDQELLEERLKADASHSHDNDIPTRILNTITLPIYALAALWDYGTSQLNPINFSAKKLTLIQAWKKQRGTKEDHHEELALNTNPQNKSSKEWKVEHLVFLIKKHEKKHLDTALIGREIALEKKARLKQLIHKLYNPGNESLSDILAEAKKDPIYNRHRLFAANKEQTNTQLFIEELSLCVAQS